VERLGYPRWPPYLDGTSKEDFRHGANFAVASGTALSRRFFERKHLNVDEITPYSLAVQIRWFKQVLDMLLASTDDLGMYVPHHDHPIAIDQRQFLSGPSWNYYPALASSVLTACSFRCLSWLKVLFASLL
jgi:hypothetical protein